MALSAPTVLAAAATTTPSNPQSSASISPTANTPGIIVAVDSRNPATTITAAAGAGLNLGTITAITDVLYGTIASSTRRMYAWWYNGAASPGSGTVDFTYGAAPNGASWLLLEWPGMDRTAPIIANATNRADTSTGITVSLSDGGGALTWDGTLGVFANGDSTVTINIGGAFTNIGQLTCASTNSFKFRSQYALSKLTSVDCTQTSAHLGGIALGVAAASGGVGPDLVRSVGSRTRRPSASLW